jgi:hypothetical protein
LAGDPIARRRWNGRRRDGRHGQRLARGEAKKALFFFPFYFFSVFQAMGGDAGLPDRTSDNAGDRVVLS